MFKRRVIGACTIIAEIPCISIGKNQFIIITNFTYDISHRSDRRKYGEVSVIGFFFLMKGPLKKLVHYKIYCKNYPNFNPLAGINHSNHPVHIITIYSLYTAVAFYPRISFCRSHRLKKG